jgi:hypothetical protein
LELTEEHAQPKNSAVTMAKELYLALVLERNTTGCFLALHEIRQSPRHKAKLEVERLSSGLQALSESQKALSYILVLE